MSSSSSNQHSTTAEALYRFAASSVGAIFAETLTLPTDVAKTRLQVQKSTASAGSGQPYTGFANCVSRMYREEGARALWKGLAPALIRQVCYSSLSLVLYEPVRAVYGRAFTSLSLRKDGTPTFAERLLAGGTAGICGVFRLAPSQ